MPHAGKRVQWSVLYINLAYYDIKYYYYRYYMQTYGLLLKIKKTISLLLLMVYLFSNNLWVIPVVEYYYNLDDIIKNYCVERDLEENVCMGSCYLNNKIKEAVKEQKYGDTTSEKPNYSLQIVSLHLTPSLDNIEPHSNHEAFNSFYFFTLTENKTQILLPPPKV